jgi:hypothetical protein|tara:strand:- start:234 stop:698 length:465 start_codon:yes stop_codon:yes gene_type:complete
MKKVSLDTWIQFIGMIGLLGGLLFVGLEMRQSQTIAIGGQVQARNDAIMSFFSSPLDGNETALYLFEQGLGEDFVPKNEEERAVFSQIVRIRVVSLQNAWQQYTLGLIPTDTFEYSKDRIMRLYETCRLRPIVIARASSEFLEFLETNSTVDCV